ncbi:hypothetical protein QYE76_037054 [Lolium multiflorum]|uniref:Uncharacterized protein n=1 Tax=Lolium multiflorum TaxID=4521 RepID=A0AAD8R312_LOLMU|nr:hypothetical protein QYE76_037054 [Lolium multiflorum]
MRKVKKKTGQENIQKAVKAAMDAADAALSAGKPFCIAHVDVGLNAAALREAVFKCMNRVPTMLFSTDMASNKVVVYAGVPPEALPIGLKVLERLWPRLDHSREEEGNDASRLKEAMEVATQIALKKTSCLSCPRDGSTADSAGYSGLPRFERKSDEKSERTEVRNREWG